MTFFIYMITKSTGKNKSNDAESSFKVPSSSKVRSSSSFMAIIANADSFAWLMLT